ncbi:MAG: transporter [Hyphomonadaceae bacterium]
MRRWPRSPAAPALAQDFTPGRPGATESPIAVPQGRWQIETEIASFARDDDSDADALSLLETTFRYGIARGWDAEAIVSPYNRVDAPGGDDSGAGDITLRLRKTFAGLDGGQSFGLIGYVTLPTGDDGFGADEVEGGVIAAGGIDLSDDWDLTWTAGLGAVSDGNDDYDAALRRRRLRPRPHGPVRLLCRGVRRACR